MGLKSLYWILVVPNSVRPSYCLSTGACIIFLAHPMMFQMKFDFDRPAGLRDVHVGKCGQRDTCTHGRRLSVSLYDGTRDVVCA